MRNQCFFRNHRWKTLGATAVLAVSGIVSYQRLGANPEQAAMEEFAGGRPVAAWAAGPVERPVLAAEKPPMSAQNVTEHVGRRSEPNKSDFVEIALKEYGKYEHLPYVWGGESPLTYEETLKDPFFKGVSVTKRQPAGNWRSGQPTIPGFDCAGWPWYVGKGAGKKPFTDVRASAEGYRTHPSAERVWDGKLSAETEILMEPGDLIFMLRGNKAYHVAMYLGGGNIMECSGTERPDYESITPDQWEEWREYANPEEHGKTDWNRGGLQIPPLSKYSGKHVSVRRF